MGARDHTRFQPVNSHFSTCAFPYALKCHNAGFAPWERLLPGAGGSFGAARLAEFR
jgi:hypothetical protein